MTIKISQFTPISAIATGTIFAVVDPTGPTSYNATASQLQTFILGGNAATATKLLSPANINGVAFDGSAGITVTADAGTLTGNTLASGVTASSLTSVGTLTNLTVTNTISGSINGNAATATKFAAAVTINGVSFDGSENILITTSVAAATTTTIGAVIIGSGLTVQLDGTIAVDTDTIATKTYVDNTSTDNAISFSVALG